MTEHARTQSRIAADTALFQEVLDRWAEAIVADDASGIAGFTEPSWLIVTPESGPVRLDRFLGAVASGHLTHDAMTFELLEVRRVGDLAIVLAHGRNSGQWQGEPFAADEWVTEVFTRSGDGWRCLISALTPNYAAPVKRPVS